MERGLYHLDKGEYDDAIADLTEAIAQEPVNSELYATRGFIYLESNREEYLDYARADFEYALYLDPEQWPANYCLGMIAYARQAYHEALRCFSVAREQAPLRSEIYYYRALCYYKLDDPLRAIDEMDLALDLFVSRDSRKSDARKWLREFKKAAQKIKPLESPELVPRPALTDGTVSPDRSPSE